MMNYDVEKTKKVQEVILSIMKELHKILTENNFTYYLCGGSVLGAIRHNGFIPWDDDLDILMPRADYERFIKEGSKYLPKNLYLQSPENEKNTHYMFAKVRLKNTLFEETANKNMDFPRGIFVDIFPLDYSSESEEKYFKRMKKVNFLKKIYKLQANNDGKHKILHFLSKIISHKYVYRKCNNIIKNSCNDDGIYAIESLSFYNPSKVRFNKQVFGIPVLHQFEDTQFYIPNNADLYLKTKIGDYMTLPPIEKRGVQHSTVRIEFSYDDSKYFE